MPASNSVSDDAGLTGSGGLSMSMPTASHPPKHLVREYLERRARDTQPPPPPEEVRRQLGWGMLMTADDKAGAPAT
jgi:hypothetical protein